MPGAIDATMVGASSTTPPTTTVAAPAAIKSIRPQRFPPACRFDMVIPDW
jgi:hypothetical protein